MTLTVGTAGCRRVIRDGRMGHGSESVGAVDAAVKGSVVVECADSAAVVASERHVQLRPHHFCRRKEALSQAVGAQEGHKGQPPFIVSGFRSLRFQKKATALSDEQVVRGRLRSGCENHPSISGRSLHHVAVRAAGRTLAGEVRRPIVCVRGRSSRHWCPDQPWSWLKKTGCRALLEFRLGA